MSPRTASWRTLPPRTTAAALTWSATAVPDARACWARQQEIISMRALAAMRETACCQPRMARWAAGRRSASAGQLTQMAVSSAGDGSKKKGRPGQGGPMKDGAAG